MDRRTFIQGSSAFLIPSFSFGATQILGASPQGLIKRSWVQRPDLVRQNCPEWCWAASIAMIFAANGHTVAQEDIVKQTFGALVCRPAGNPITIAQDLSREWTDSDGDTFKSNVVAAYDTWNGVNNLTNAFIIDELDNDRPLLYCNTHHAMVLVATDYIDTPNGPNVVAGGVLDPYPTMLGFHALSIPELYPRERGGQLTFLAAVEIDD